MTKRRRYLTTRHHAGRYRAAKVRHQRGYTVVDDTTGRAAWTEPHPVTGRPTAAYLPSLADAMAAAIELARLAGDL